MAAATVRGRSASSDGPATTYPSAPELSAASAGSSRADPATTTTGVVRPSPRSCSTNEAQLCACTSTMTAAVSRLPCSHSRAEAGVWARRQRAILCNAVNDVRATNAAPRSCAMWRIFIEADVSVLRSVGRSPPEVQSFGDLCLDEDSPHRTGRCRISSGARRSTALHRIARSRRPRHRPPAITRRATATPRLSSSRCRPRVALRL